ncbi:MAG: SPFH domain-containing protein [Solirubrobacterales bacterium]
METFLWIVLIIFVLVTLFRSIKIVSQATVGIVERLGVFNRKAEQGINVIIPFFETYRAVVDLREQVVDFPPQAVITKDNVTMQIDTVIYYQITDPFRFIYEIANPFSAIENLTATTLRNIVGDLELDHTLTSRDVVNSRLRQVLDEATDKWGIRVNRVELKNIIPPADIQQAMEKQMRAEREKREAVLRAEGQKTAAILSAEGDKQSQILQAEAHREASIREAEGYKQSAILRAEGEAQALLNYQKAYAESITMIKNANADDKVIALKSLEALREMAHGQATKLFIPSELAGLGGVFGALKSVVEAGPATAAAAPSTAPAVTP